MGKLDGKVGLVTGARRGIGRAIAIELAREGADVAVIDVKSPEDVNSVVDEIRSIGRRANAVMADVSKPDEVSKMIDRTVQDLGNLDILVNNAGVESTSKGASFALRRPRVAWLREARAGS
jgi:NAD(P)-dependent dehydrogenase (short-subunit alcohol dehydrogenase family)